jgi:hypothetical protein
MTAETRCFGCDEELNAMMLGMAASDGYLICMPCIQARAKAGSNGGRCVCPKAKKRPVYKASHWNNRVMREWHECARCLGTIKTKGAA